MAGEKNREIILVRGIEVENDNDGYKLFIDTVGEWDIISNEEFEILKIMQWKYGYNIIERNPLYKGYDKKEELRTVQDYLNSYYEDQKKSQEVAKKRTELEEKKKLERKRKQFERLKKEFEGNETN